MRDLNFRSLLVAVVVFGTPALVTAQRPTPAQAQQMLQNNPALVQQLKQRIITSGMTTEQIHARLREEGYPENLLDAYLPGSTSSAGSSPNDSVFAAVQELGIADSDDVALLRCDIDADSLVATDTILGRRTATSKTNAEFNAARRNACRARTDSLKRSNVIVKALSDSGFTLYGLDFFRHPTSQFDANLNGPVDEGYKIGPGDRLVLILTGDVEESYTLDVTREGFIVIPQVGQISVNNLTLSQLEDILYARLGRVYSGVQRGNGATTHFSITPAKLRSNLIYVVGDVRQPGAYQVSSAGTLLSALYAAGGPSDNGSLRAVQVRRNGRLVNTLDIYDYLINGDGSHDIRKTAISSSSPFIWRASESLARSYAPPPTKSSRRKHSPMRFDSPEVSAKRRHAAECRLSGSWPPTNGPMDEIV
jgi:protein involved in polysaccharide export with SLBB domain